MTTTPTERRLAITPGEAKVSKNLFGNRYQFAVYSNGPEGKDYVPIAELYGTHQEQEANLIAESINTYNACGLTPSELLAELTKLRSERDELVGALASVCNLENKLRIFERIIVDNPGRTDVRPSAADISSMIADAMDARAILSKHKPE